MNSPSRIAETATTAGSRRAPVATVVNAASSTIAIRSSKTSTPVTSSRVRRSTARSPNTLRIIVVLEIARMLPVKNASRALQPSARAALKPSQSIRPTSSSAMNAAEGPMLRSLRKRNSRPSEYINRITPSCERNSSVSRPPTSSGKSFGPSRKPARR